MERVYYHLPDHCRCKEFGNNICSGAKLLSDSPRCLFSWRELPSFLAAQQSQGKNSETAHFSFFYFIPFRNMRLGMWQGNLRLFGCVFERYLNVSSLHSSPWVYSACLGSSSLGWKPLESNFSCKLFISLGLKEFSDLPTIRTFANTSLFGLLVPSQTKKYKEA